jgi:hypothetical protein
MQSSAHRLNVRALVTTLGSAVALAWFLAGCSGSTTAHVSGKVFLADGKPLPGGTVWFFPTDGSKSLPASAQISEEGSYDMPKAPLGQVKITVTNLELKDDMPPPVGQGGGIPKMGGAKGPMTGKGAATKGAKMGPMDDSKGAAPPWQPPPKPPGTYVPIPARFSKPETSSLSYDVKPGNQTYDIKLGE